MLDSLFETTTTMPALHEFSTYVPYEHKYEVGDKAAVL